VSRYIQAGTQATVAEEVFDSLEWLLKRLSALAELTHNLAKKPWALWLGLGGVALAGYSGQAQAALGPFALAVSGGSRTRGFLSDAGRNAGDDSPDRQRTRSRPSRSRPLFSRRAELVVFRQWRLKTGDFQHSIRIEADPAARQRKSFLFSTDLSKSTIFVLLLNKPL
jgi:hypothetical protein